jgi:hypothetical protein
MTSKGHLYTSSYPFEDPRLQPGGPGIDYTYDVNGVAEKSRIEPRAPGRAWGTEVFMKNTLTGYWAQYKSNYQNLPDKAPEVNNYRGWTHMRCNMNAGK